MSTDRSVTSEGVRRGVPGEWETIWDEVLPEGDGEGLLLDAGCGEHCWHTSDWPEVVRCDTWQAYSSRRTDMPPGIEDVDLNRPWPYATDMFDGVLAIDVIEHLESLWHFFREAFRVSRRFVIISTPAVDSTFSRELFRLTGRPWGFTRDHVKHSRHLTPVFPFQLSLVQRASPGWKIAQLWHVNAPFRGVRFPDRLKRLANEQPSHRILITRYDYER